MSDKPIIFSAPMVRALLDGRKSQTRRRLKEQNSIADAVKIGGRYQWKSWKTGCILGDVALPYAPGNRLWVREAHAFVPVSAYRNSLFVEQRTDPGDPDRAAIYREGFDRSTGSIRWRPSIHMPRWASRLTLLVTDVRVQRVQEISEADAQAEGAWLGRCSCKAMREKETTPIGASFRQTWCHKHGDSFPELWNDVQSKSRGTAYSWVANPWVVALTFTVHRCNIDR